MTVQFQERGRRKQVRIFWGQRAYHFILVQENVDRYLKFSNFVQKVFVALSNACVCNFDCDMCMQQNKQCIYLSFYNIYIVIKDFFHINVLNYLGKKSPSYFSKIRTEKKRKEKLAKQFFIDPGVNSVMSKCTYIFTYLTTINCTALTHVIKF